MKWVLCSVFYLHCILISALCWLKYGINKTLFVYDGNPRTICVILKYLKVFLLVVEDEASLHLQNPLLYLIMSHMNTAHTFITQLFTIPCNHLILLLCWNILHSHLTFKIL